MSKDWFALAHEELVSEYLEENPDADWDEAYEATADAANERMQDNLADYGDHLYQQRKDARGDEA